jgi:hypothetical protein
MSGHDDGKLFLSRRAVAVRCGEPIEAHFYDPKAGERGGRLVTSISLMCATCHVTDDIVPIAEIRRERDLGAVRPRSLCAEVALKLA